VDRVAAVAPGQQLAVRREGHRTHPARLLSLTAEGKLGFFDTAADKEVKQVEVDFKPTVLARQGDQLFAVAKGTAIVHVLEAASGKEVKQIRVPGEPIQALACHPGKG
jgi:hypothetical protein